MVIWRCFTNWFLVQPRPANYLCIVVVQCRWSTREMANSISFGVSSNRRPHKNKPPQLIHPLQTDSEPKAILCGHGAELKTTVPECKAISDVGDAAFVAPPAGQPEGWNVQSISLPVLLRSVHSGGRRRKLQLLTLMRSLVKIPFVPRARLKGRIRRGSGSLYLRAGSASPTGATLRAACSYGEGLGLPVVARNPSWAKHRISFVGRQKIT